MMKATSVAFAVCRFARIRPVSFVMSGASMDFDESEKSNKHGAAPIQESRLLDGAGRSTNGSPCSDGCDAQQPSIHLIDIYEYLNDVEQELCGDTMVQMMITETHRKTMLRTLLGLLKVEFDDRIREERARLQYDRVVEFLKEELIPVLDSGVVIDEVAAPDFRSALHSVLNQPPSLRRASADSICSPLARGRMYKGKFQDLLSDIVPELVTKYQHAANLCEQDVMLSLVDNIASDNDTVDAAACRKCIQCSLPLVMQDYSPKMAEDGLQCELSCLDYLDGRHCTASHVILGKVLLKTRNGKRVSRKVHDGAVIETSIDLDKTCSEFDAMVVERVTDANDTTTGFYLKEVWEAKLTLSPMTIHDALAKKLASIKMIFEGDDATLLLDGKEYSFIADDQLVFGVYGKELLPPNQAANQLNVVACSTALSRDKDTVLLALDTGYARISSERSLERLRLLRSSAAGDVKHLLVAVAKPSVRTTAS